MKSLLAYSECPLIITTQLSCSLPVVQCDLLGGGVQNIDLNVVCRVNDVWLHTHLRGKRVQRQPMTNGGINLEIGNPSYNMYEVDHDNHADAGSLLRPNFTLDPQKVSWWMNLCFLL